MVNGMETGLKKICKNVQNGILLEESIPQLFNSLADRYQTGAFVRLAMHYFTLYESYCDDEDTWSREAVEEIDKINHIIREYVLKNPSGEEREKAIKEIDGIRKNITKRMNILAAYTDNLQNNEYVLNRVEYRFAKVVNTTDDIEFSRKILQYIFDSQDNIVINEKIKEIIAQLPMRITRQKYFEILGESIGNYLGADKASLDTFLYMLRTTAMLYREEGMETLYPGLWKKKEYLAGIDYTNITNEEYEKAVTTLQAATLLLETDTSVWLGLQEIINEIYTILLCSSYSGMAGDHYETIEKAATSIISDINDIYRKKEKVEVSDSFVGKFAELEGIQEELSFDAQTLEYTLEKVQYSHASMVESLMLGQFMNVLKRSQDLLSNSLFIDLEAKEDVTIVDEDHITSEAAVLEKELKDLFAAQDRMVSRAVMANTINRLPVFFGSHKEVMDYVIYSLERCTDRFEKAASYEIINGIMVQ
jgi:hypothetical protein